MINPLRHHFRGWQLPIQYRDEEWVVAIAQLISLGGSEATLT